MRSVTNIRCAEVAWQPLSLDNFLHWITSTNCHNSHHKIIIIIITNFLRHLHLHLSSLPSSHSALSLVLTYNWKSEIMKILTTWYCTVPWSEFSILVTLTILVLLVSDIFQIVSDIFQIVNWMPNISKTFSDQLSQFKKRFKTVQNIQQWSNSRQNLESGVWKPAAVET